VPFESEPGVKPHGARSEACICCVAYTDVGQGREQDAEALWTLRMEWPFCCGSRLAATRFRSCRGRKQLIEVP